MASLLVLTTNFGRAKAERTCRQAILAGLQEFLVAGAVAQADGTRQDPPLEAFEAEIARFKGIQDQIQVGSSALHLSIT